MQENINETQKGYFKKTDIQRVTINTLKTSKYFMLLRISFWFLDLDDNYTAIVTLKESILILIPRMIGFGYLQFQLKDFNYFWFEFLLMIVNAFITIYSCFLILKLKFMCKSLKYLSIFILSYTTFSSF
jgi:hypothetical protein